MKRWIVKRTLVEAYEVLAETKQEALENAQDPFSIIVKSQSARVAKDEEALAKERTE